MSSLERIKQLAAELICGKIDGETFAMAVIELDWDDDVSQFVAEAIAAKAKS